MSTYQPKGNIVAWRQKFGQTDEPRWVLFDFDPLTVHDNGKETEPLIPLHLLTALAEKWKSEIAAFEAVQDSADPEDWMAGDRRCLNDLLEIIKND